MQVISIRFWACSFVKLQILALSGFFFFYSYWGKECFLEVELEWRVLQQSFRLEETTERGTVFQFLVCLFFFSLANK